MRRIDKHTTTKNPRKYKSNRSDTPDSSRPHSTCTSTRRSGSGAPRGEFSCSNGGSKSRGDGVLLVSPRGIPSWDELWIYFLGFWDTSAALELLVGLASAQLCFESKPRAARMAFADGVFARVTERLDISEWALLVGERGRSSSVTFGMAVMSTLCERESEGEP